MRSSKAIAVLVIFIMIYGCKKEFLDESPNSTFVVPKTLTELQALLDNTQINSYAPQLGDLSCDDYYLENSTLEAQDLVVRNCYIWADDIFEGRSNADWNDAYKWPIFVSNVVLDRIPQIQNNSSNAAAWNNAKGTALFYRSFAFFQLAQVFCKPYDSLTANQDMGIPIRTNPDVNDQSVRATVKETYELIIADLINSASLLPSILPAERNRPSRPAAYALLSRVFLSMRSYEKAGEYADSALSIYNKLLDYNSAEFDPNATRPFRGPFNDEVLIAWTQEFYEVFNATTTIIDSTLYQSYSDADRRKILFFNVSDGLPYYRGSYTGNATSSYALTTAELFLTRAECSARRNELDQARNDLDTLLYKRYNSGTYTPEVVSSSVELLSLILSERRKELIFRGIRWMDLRRLNFESSFAKTLTRIVNGVTITLAPNDVLYTLPIPDDEIRASGIPQNPR